MSTTHASASDARSSEWALDTARDIIDAIDNGARDGDSGHRFCSNCFRKVRDVEPPKPETHWRGDQAETRRAAVGFATPTEHVEYGVDEIELDEYRSVYRTALVCECGATRPSTRERPVRVATAVEFARNLSAAVDTLREEARLAGDDEADRVEAWRHSEEALVRAVRALKTNPSTTKASVELRSDDNPDPLFIAALGAALKHR